VKSTKPQLEDAFAKLLAAEEIPNVSGKTITNEKEYLSSFL